jgi:hypothetical protein
MTIRVLGHYIPLERIIWFSAETLLPPITDWNSKRPASRCQ